MNSHIKIRLPERAKELNASDYVACIENEIASTPNADTQLLNAIKGSTNNLRGLAKAFCQYGEPQYAEIIRNIPIVVFPTCELNAYISKPPSRKGEFIFIDPWVHFCVEQTTLSKMTDIGTFGLLLGYAFSSLESIHIGRVCEAFVNPDRAKAARELSFTALLFALAHEFGHAICGHLKDERALATKTIPFLSDAEILVRQQSRQQELEADTVALKILIDCHKGVNNAKQLWNLIGHVESLMWILNAVELMRNKYEWRKVLADAGYDRGICLLNKALDEKMWNEELEKRVSKEVLKPAIKIANDFLAQSNRTSTHPNASTRINNLRNRAEEVIGPCPKAARCAREEMKNAWTNAEFVERCETMGRDWFDDSRNKVRDERLSK